MKGEFFMNRKKIVLCTLALSAVILNVNSIIPIYANTVINSDIKNMIPRYKYVQYAKSDLTIRNGNATIKSYMSSSVKTTKSLITSRLQKKVSGSWTTIDSWTTSTNKNSCSLSKVKSVAKGYEYRVFSTVKAYYNSDSESIAVYSPVKRY